jgi:hypothetical protein
MAQKTEVTMKPKRIGTLLETPPRPITKASFGSLIGEVGLRVLDAAAKNPQAVVDTAVAVGNVYASREHNERIGWLHSLTKHGNEGVRTASATLIKALDVAGVKAVVTVAPKLSTVPR